MAAPIKDASFRGLRALEVWASHDDDRRFEITFDGPIRQVNGSIAWKGGYKVALHDTADRGPLLWYVKATLEDAAVEAIAAFNEKNKRATR